MRRREFVGGVTTAMAGSMLAGCLPAFGGGGTPSGPLDAEAWGRERRWMDLPVARVAYLEWGRGPAALFLHGFPLSAFQWRGAIERLSPYRRCLAPDFLAAGRTIVAPGASVTPDAQVEMLVAFLRRLGIEQADVVANDSGGAVAQLLAVRYPALVRSILLTNCDEEQQSPPPAMAPVIALAHAGKFADEWIAPWVADHALARSANAIGGWCYLDPRHLTDEAIEEHLAPLVATSERKALLHRYAIGLEQNPLAGITPRLREVLAPARIVWGTGDTIFEPGCADRLDRAFGNSRGIRRLEGYKLFWPEERPDIVAEEARQLWGV